MDISHACRHIMSLKTLAKKILVECEVVEINEAI